MQELDHKEGWALKNWCFWTVVLEKTLESPLDCKEMEPVNPKGNQPWIFTGRTDAEAEAPILWPPDAKSPLTGKLWCWARLKVGERDDRGWEGWMASRSQRTWVWAGETWHASVHGVAKSRTQLSDWTTSTWSLGMSQAQSVCVCVCVCVSVCVSVCVCLCVFISKESDTTERLNINNMVSRNEPSTISVCVCVCVSVCLCVCLCVFISSILFQCPAHAWHAAVHGVAKSRTQLSD